MIDLKNIQEEENMDFLKNKEDKFIQLGFFQLLKLWDKNTRKIWKEKILINSLIKEKDFSTLFELKKNGYNFSSKQKEKINKSVNQSLVVRQYENKFSVIETLENYQVEIEPEQYYHLLISNEFNTDLDKVNYLNSVKRNLTQDIQIKEKNINKVLVLLENPEFKAGLYEFIIKDIQQRPEGFSEGLGWSMDRAAYYEPTKNSHLFGGMTKTQLNKIIKSRMGNEQIMNEYRSLMNKAPIDNQILEKLGINTKSLVEKAQRTLLLNEDSLSADMKDMIEKISNVIEKIQKHDNKSYQEEIVKITDNILPNVIKKYLSIDEEYRTTLKNIEGKYPSELLLESLNNIYIQVNYINQSINEEKIFNLSIDNRKLKIK